MQAHLIRFVVFGLCSSWSISSSNICPKVCSLCLDDVISCSSGGLREIPSDLHVDTKKINLIGHSFTQSSLTRQNFSRFSKPKYSIEQLSIRKSNIKTIQTDAFFDLSGLDSLDLSENLNLTIEDRAFANLKLKYLRLDKVGHLILSSTAFDGLLVSSLSITRSNLREFPFRLLKPLTKDLRKLFLSNNFLRNLSPKFESLFRHLTVLDLHHNPFLCSCGLLWLRTTLHWRRHNFRSQDSSLSKGVSPTCDGPPYLKGKHIESIAESEFDCVPPKLERIEIQFQNVQKAILRCSATRYTRRAPMNISWTYENEDAHFYQKLSESKDHSEALITVQRRQVLDRFVCLLNSDTGNVSIRIHITWPQTTTLRNRTFQSLGTSNKPSSYNRNFFLKEQYSLLELMGSVVGTIVITLLLFVIIYRFYFCKSMKLKKEQMRKSGYASYEAELYSDSQTYDIPHNPSFDHETKIFRPVFAVPHRSQLLVDHTIHKI